MMAAIGVAIQDGLPGNIYMSHLLPINPEGKTFETAPAMPFHRLDLKADEFVQALEDEMGRAIVRDVQDKRERAILVSVSTKGNREEQIESMEELKELARSADVVVLDAIIQRPKEFNPKYLMGSGKLKELVINALQKEASLIIFDQELTSTQ
ncbi:MAG: GTPase HflX, partial [Deltaproteobacteria bacterium]|nr:GTPase HflX [Deltaproteobacteria bacterium]